LNPDEVEVGEREGVRELAVLALSDSDSAGPIVLDNSAVGEEGDGCEELADIPSVAA
jgi:hypothetical protein